MTSNYEIIYSICAQQDEKPSNLQKFEATLRHKGMGVFLDIRELSEGDGSRGAQLVFDALKAVLRTPVYRQRAQLVKRKIDAGPFGPAEKLVKWVEFAAEFPDVRSHSLNVFKQNY